MEIKYIKREEIDKLKWDSCVHFAYNGNLFGYTWYLDHIAKEWDGLVEGDYQSVMPLIKKDEKTLHVPDLIPKSGIYSIHILSPKRIRAFLGQIPTTFQKRDIAFTDHLQLKAFEGLETVEDYQLNLADGYLSIHSKYKPELVSALDAAEEEGYVLTNGTKPEELADFYLEHHPNAKEENKHAYLRIIYNLQHRGNGFISAIKDKTGKIVAADFFCFSHGRIFSMMPTHAGQEHFPALLRLTDLQIQTHAGKPVLLDFNTTMGNASPFLFNAQKNSYSLLQQDFRPVWKKWLPF